MEERRFNGMKIAAEPRPYTDVCVISTHDATFPPCYHLHMTMRSRALQTHARLVSLNGGVILAVCILFTAFFIAAVLATRLTGAQSVLFGVLMIAAWIYLLDAATERLSFSHGELERRSLLGRQARLNVNAMDTLLLFHEGLNQEVGIDSIVIRRGGREERLPLGPCWRHRDVEAFLASVGQATT